MDFKEGEIIKSFKTGGAITHFLPIFINGRIYGIVDLSSSRVWKPNATIPNIVECGKFHIEKYTLNPLMGLTRLGTCEARDIVEVYPGTNSAHPAIIIDISNITNRRNDLSCLAFSEPLGTRLVNIQKNKKLLVKSVSKIEFACYRE